MTTHLLDLRQVSRASAPAQPTPPAPPAKPKAPGVLRSLLPQLGGALVIAALVLGLQLVPAQPTGTAAEDLRIRAVSSSAGVAVEAGIVSAGDEVTFLVRSPDGRRREVSQMAETDGVARLAVPRAALVAAGDYFALAKSGTRLSPEVRIFTAAAVPAEVFIRADASSAAVSAATPIRALVRDATGSPISNVSVKFLVSRTALLSPESATTDASGIARTTVTAFSAGTLRLAAEAGSVRSDVTSLEIADTAGTADFWNAASQTQTADDFWSARDAAFGATTSPSLSTTAGTDFWSPESRVQSPETSGQSSTSATKLDSRLQTLASTNSLEDWRSRAFATLSPVISPWADPTASGDTYASLINPNATTRSHENTITPNLYASLIGPENPATSGSSDATTNPTASALPTATAGTAPSFSLEILGSQPIQAGVPISIRVRALGTSGSPDEKFTGTLRFSSTDPRATLPDTPRILTADRGQRVFDLAVTFSSAGVWDLTVIDADDASRIGTLKNIQVAAGEIGGDAPVILSPTNGSVLSSATLRVSGTAKPGAAVILRDGDQPLGQTGADLAGSWLVETEPVTDGSHILTAVAIKDGKTSPPSEAVTVQTDTAKPSSAELRFEPAIASPGASLEAILTSEAELDEASLILDRRVIPLRADAGDPTRYRATFRAGETVGEQTVGLTLRDSVGNESQIPSAGTFTVEVAKLEAPAAPTGLRLAASGTSEIRASWTPVSGATSYEVRWGLLPDALTRTVTATSTSATISGLQAGATYYATVRAISSKGLRSEDSGSASAVMPRATAPSNLVRVRRVPVPETGPIPLAVIAGIAAAGAVIRRKRAT